VRSTEAVVDLEEARHRRAHGCTVSGTVAQKAQEILKKPVIGEDEIGDVTAAGAGELHIAHRSSLGISARVRKRSFSELRR
jgi:hypothetical protein